MSAALFDPAGPGRWIPTDYARGPWDPRACHGGPVSALLARAIERVDRSGAGNVLDDDDRWQVARLTVELTRPVPVGRPLDLETLVERGGKRVSLAAAVLSDDGTEVARVRALRVRRASFAIPDETCLPPSDPPGLPESGSAQRVTWAVDDHPAFHKDACEHRFTEGSWDRPGPVAVWIKLLVPVVAGEMPSGVQRAAAAADFGNGVSAALPFEQFTYINPDLTVHLQRPPIGEWIGMRSASLYGTSDHSWISSGAGLAESELYDASGRLGRSVQSLFVDER